MELQKKDEILKREIKKGNIKFPCILLGDSKLDHEVASLNNIDFVFVSSWKEFTEYKTYCSDHSIKIISRLYDLVI